MNDPFITPKIVGINMVPEPKPNRAGNTIVAFFDAIFAGIRLNSCALARTPARGFTVYLPKLDGPDAQRRSVTIVENRVRHAFMEAARTAYRALGGTEAEWEPHSLT